MCSDLAGMDPLFCMTQKPAFLGELMLAAPWAFFKAQQVLQWPSHSSHAHQLLAHPQGHVTVDDEYCNMSKQRNIQAATRTRTVRSYEDSRENHLALLANKRATDAATKRKVCPASLCAQRHCVFHVVFLMASAMSVCLLLMRCCLCQKRRLLHRAEGACCWLNRG